MCHIVPICHFPMELEFSHTLCHIICIFVVSVLCHIVLICHFCVELKFITHAHRMLQSFILSILLLLLRVVEVYHTRTQNAILFTLLLL